MPFTVLLLLALLEQLTQPSQTFLVGFLYLWEAQPLQPDLLLRISADTAILLQQFLLVFLEIGFDDGNLFARERRHPAQDLVVGSATLKIRDQILHGDPARRELRPPAAVHDLDFVLHHRPLPTG